MKSISQKRGATQALLDASFHIPECSKEYWSDDYTPFIQMLQVIEDYLPPLVRPRKQTGRPAYPYLPFIRSMLAKAYFEIDKTRNLVQRLKGEPNLRLLCGFKQVPSEATFSRIFAYIGEQHIWEQGLDCLVKHAHKDMVVYHVNRDSTMIAAREKVPQKEQTREEPPKKKRGRPAKNAPQVPKEPTELERQVGEEAMVSLERVPKHCAWGCKKNSQGHIQTTKGYKVHLDVSDIGFPLTAVVTGANVHDSQLAIPLEKLTEQKGSFCYSLMDAGYDAKTIAAFIRDRGRVPIIDPNKRTNAERPPLDPAKKERYKIRTTVERANSHLKGSLLPKALYVKGYTKVASVIFSAVLCLAALKYLQYFIAF